MDEKIGGDFFRRDAASGGFCMAAVVPGRIVILDEPTNDIDHCAAVCSGKRYEL